eukprot:CAMPEP_0113899392 /NCGR_PEP_ID=MMETSP0780_2-20120614/19999_1 /TAXON_ID=652834 /ORGANISM="Palpitomonas bilix" /LENGTH=391 /DNA_ID=CAMNT_0000891541 /DNA_START=359 /DNA_END=1534 /DNA_ORIENTATION=- /assembly_acc=CAM_ASM_000599
MPTPSFWAWMAAHPSFTPLFQPHPHHGEQLAVSPSQPIPPAAGVPRPPFLADQFKKALATMKAKHEKHVQPFLTKASHSISRVAGQAALHANAAHPHPFLLEFAAHRMAAAGIPMPVAVARQEEEGEKATSSSDDGKPSDKDDSKKRKRFTEEQQRVLVEECRKAKESREGFSKARRKKVAAQLGLTEKQVTTFFNNLKAKQKKTKVFMKKIFDKTKSAFSKTGDRAIAAFSALKAAAKVKKGQETCTIVDGGLASPVDMIQSALAIPEAAGEGDAPLPSQAASYSRLLRLVPVDGSAVEVQSQDVTPSAVVPELTADAKEKFRFSDAQQEQLYALFYARQGVVPAKFERIEIGKSLGLTERQVHSFFNNRKAAEKKRQKKMREQGKPSSI